MCRALAAATLALALLAACGQKGPLYLPDQGGNVVVRPAAEPTPAPAPVDDDADPKSGRKPPEAAPAP
ncbi:MAG TPA: lipoprotein [Steroidobacteraceae bacterium]|jgi:predicted small lipoprotein YifL|nr:lipoprotein [Steroidobacteraceae bacterium]HNS27090.1 lipoprotein [Steroidobacteraceae bacterium]